jgi:hypothetical protein
LKASAKRKAPDNPASPSPAKAGEVLSVAGPLARSGGSSPRYDALARADLREDPNPKSRATIPKPGATISKPAATNQIFRFS